jgi:uncharacterized protein (DUF58 family)
MAESASVRSDKSQRLQRLRLEAEALSAAFGRVESKARASANDFGDSGRKRAGVGESFWQYRRFVREDGADRIDWRRSGRDDKLFVRETELETARTVLFWSDPAPGFDWRFDNSRESKADYAITLLTALAASLGRGGEKCGGLMAARPAVAGSEALARVCESLVEGPIARQVSDTQAGLDVGPQLEPPGAKRVAFVLASDLFGEPQAWKDALNRLAEHQRAGVMLAINDPAEIMFPFTGRVRFQQPGASEPSVVVGKAEALQAAYLERFSAQRAVMRDSLAALNWPLVEAQTSEDKQDVLARLILAVRSLGLTV